MFNSWKLCIGCWIVCTIPLCVVQELHAATSDQDHTHTACKASWKLTDMPATSRRILPDISIWLQVLRQRVPDNLKVILRIWFWVILWHYLEPFMHNVVRSYVQTRFMVPNQSVLDRFWNWVCELLANGLNWPTCVKVAETSNINRCPWDWWFSRFSKISRTPTKTQGFEHFL